jgi:hypothetical protein
MKLEDGTPYTSPACEEASEQDRVWFAAHPQGTPCLRPVIHGEFPPGLADDCPYVLVRQLVPGLRLRQPVRLIVLPEANSCN